MKKKADTVRYTADAPIGPHDEVASGARDALLARLHAQPPSRSNAGRARSSMRTTGEPPQEGAAMTAYAAKPNAAWKPIHPGEILREDVLPALGMSVKDAAAQLGVSRQMLHNILNGTAAVTPEMALRLGKFCGNGPEVWLRMQQARDLWEAARALGAALKKIPTHRAA
jgi:antitoxin HigA-1